MVKQAWQYLQLSVMMKMVVKLLFHKVLLLELRQQQQQQPQQLLVITMDQVSQSLVSYLYWFCDN